MERKKLEELRAIYTDYLAWELAGACRGVSSMEGGAVYAAAYVLLKAQSVEDVQLYTLDAFVESSGISESRAFFIKECSNRRLLRKARYRNVHLRKFFKMNLLSFSYPLIKRVYFFNKRFNFK